MKLRKVAPHRDESTVRCSPFIMANMACSLTPNRMYRPAYDPKPVDGHWKSSLPFHFVKFDAVKSADPPTSSGRFGAKAFNKFSESLRVAI